MAGIIHPARGLSGETEAIIQIDRVAAHPMCLGAVGLPDLHPGKGGPVGMAALFQKPIPALLGNDVGCGFSLFALDIKPKKLVDVARLTERLTEAALDEPGKVFSDLLMGHAHDGSLGTVGGGNHFVEIQRVHAADAASGIAEGQALLLVHSGSRALGEEVFRRMAAQHGERPLEEFAAWLAEHDFLVEWARRNRIALARRTAEALGCQHELVLDLPHNFVERTPQGFLHRKGASPADRGFSVLPGSRGTPTFLLAPAVDACARLSLNSLPHGAGRRIARGAARSVSRDPEEFRVSPPLIKGGQGAIAICGDRDLLVEERPGAYKDVRAVLGGTEDAGLARLLAEFHPLVTFKCGGSREAARDRTRGRDAKTASRERRDNRR